MVKHCFSFSAIPELAKKLTPVQKKLFDELWISFAQTGHLFPARNLPRIIGKQPIKEAFDGLNGALIVETTEQGIRHFKLTIYGALLTSGGSVLATYLIQLLDLVKKLYEGDTFIKELNKAQIQSELKLSEADTKLLFRLLNLDLPYGMPFHLSGWQPDGSNWSISISDEVMELYQSEETKLYLDERLSAGYRPEEPCFYDDRLAKFGRNSAKFPIAISTDKNGNSWAGNGDSFISQMRLQALKSIEGARFDCTRLINMCEEINDCASSGNAHAVIMLTRGILDHVPPVFGFKKFGDVATSYTGGGSTFKGSMEQLESHARKVADRLLHMPIRDKEVVPHMREVDFARELETMLGEFCRVLK